MHNLAKKATVETNSKPEHKIKGGKSVLSNSLGLLDVTQKVDLKFFGGWGDKSLLGADSALVSKRLFSTSPLKL